MMLETFSEKGEAMGMYDIAVIGGGASGLAAAAAASEQARHAQKHLKIAVLEKNPRVGKKLLMTGNGRCNLENMNAAPEHYHGDTAEAASILKRFPPEKILEAFRAHGLFCREMDEGRVYPYSLQASSVLNILRRAIDTAGVETICDFPVQNIENISGGFSVSSEKGRVNARKVIVAAGGKACPQSGSEGDGYGLLRVFRHSVVPLLPALVQLRTDTKRVRPLKGVRCMAAASLLENGREKKTVRGEVQFTENSLSGICIFELSRFLESKTAEVSLDLVPEYTAADLESFFRVQARQCGELPAAQLTEGLLNKALGTEVVKAALNGASVPAGALSEADFRNLAGQVKHFRFPIQGKAPFQNAQVTAGGIPLAEVDENLQSRLCQGIYLCGELLNLDGECGGYNLHWAWASGITAGVAAASALLHS